MATLIEHTFRATNKGLRVVTLKVTKKFAKCCEEIQIHTNRNDLTPRSFYSPIGFKKN